MIIVSGKVKAAPGAMAGLNAQMEEVIRETRKEPGCIDYSYGVDVLDPDTLVILEYWQDWDALQAHFARPHMQPWIKTLSEIDLIAKDVKAGECGEIRQLMS